MSTRAHITLIVDRSGSMATTKTEAEAGIRQFIEDQAKLDAKVKVALYQFDNVYEAVYGPVKIKDAPAYTLEPRSMTALFDAVGKGIEDTALAVKDAKHTPDKVVVVIVTDGMENASKEHTRESVTKLVEGRKAKGWEFVFLAGDLNAASFARDAGLTTTNYDPAKAGQTQAVYATTSRGVSNFLDGTTSAVKVPDSVD